MMSDDFLSHLREEPRTEFSRDLRQRLRSIEAEGAEPAAHRGRRRTLALAWTAAASVAVFALMLPPVRAAAREFLDLFRVKRFAAVPVDPERLTRLQQGGLDLKALVSEQVEVIDPARKPEVVDGPEAAGEAAGIVVRRPSTIPRGAELTEIAVGHPGAFRVKLDVSKMEMVAKTVGVEDAEIPAEWDGATLEVQAPPVVVLRYHRGSDDFVLLQSKSPEVSLPPGVDLARLGALGLRVAGMSPEEARLFARSIDWRSTVLVPIPVQGGTFREVDVHGRKGLLVTSNHPPRSAAEGETRSGSRWHSVLLWAEGNEVFALHGPGQGVEVLEMAQSIG
jgi:hypothetical protein